MTENKVAEVQSNSLERTNSQRRFAEALAQRLSSPDAITIMYDPQKGRTGRARVTVVDSPTGKIHIAIIAGAPGNGSSVVGLNNVESTWLVEDQMQFGLVQFVDRADSHAYRSKFETNVDPKYLAYWQKTGGIDYRPGGGGIRPAVTDEQFEELVAELAGGHVNPDLTMASLHYLMQTYGAKRINENEAIASNPSGSTPELPEEL